MLGWNLKFSNWQEYFWSRCPWSDSRGQPYHLSLVQTAQARDSKCYFESIEIAANVHPGCIWSSSELLFLISKPSILIIVEIDTTQLDCLRRQGTRASLYSSEREPWVHRSTCTNTYKSSSDLLLSPRVVLVNLNPGLRCSCSCIPSPCCYCWVLGGCLISLYREPIISYWVLIIFVQIKFDI